MPSPWLDSTRLDLAWRDHAALFEARTTFDSPRSQL
jgi:hypothetical protein